MAKLSPERSRSMRGPRMVAARLCCPECGDAMEAVFRRRGLAYVRVPGLYYCPADDRFARRGEPALDPSVGVAG